MRRVGNSEFKHPLWLGPQPVAFLNDAERDHLLETVGRDIEAQAKKEAPPRVLPTEKHDVRKGKGARVISTKDIIDS